MTKKEVIINNLLISYYHSEGHNGKTLLFLHGWRSESKVWFNIINDLSEKGYEIFAMDLPGFGNSQTPNEVFDTKKYSEVVKEFIQKLNLSDVIGIGHSFGGRLLALLNINDQELFSKIILVDNSGIKINKTEISIYSNASKLVKPIFKLPFMKGVRRKIYSKIGADDYISAEDSPFFKDTFLNITKDDLTEDLYKITTPTLIIWGEKDKDTPLEMARIINNKIKNSTLKVIPDATHYSFIDNKDLFLEYLEEFIQASR